MTECLIIDFIATSNEQQKKRNITSAHSRPVPRSQATTVRQRYSSQANLCSNNTQGIIRMGTHAQKHQDNKHIESDKILM